MRIKEFCMVVLCTCLFMACEKGDDEVFDPIKPPIEQPEKPVDPEQPEEPEKPVTPPSINDIININIGGIKMIVGSNNWLAIAYGGGKYVAVAKDNYVTSSSNGTSWSTPKQISFTELLELKAIAYGGGKFMAFGYKSNYGSCFTTSSDGVTWSTPVRLEETKNQNISTVTYVNGRFIASSGNGRVIASDDNGNTWKILGDFSGRNLVCSCYDSEHNIVALAGSSSFLYSTDKGENWTVTYPIQLGYQVRGVAYGGGSWVCVGAEYATSHSTDLSTWTRVNANNIFSTKMTGVVYGNGKFVAISSGSRIGYSTDGGITWQDATEVTDRVATPNALCVMP